MEEIDELNMDLINFTKLLQLGQLHYAVIDYTNNFREIDLLFFFVQHVLS